MATLKPFPKEVHFPHLPSCMMDFYASCVQAVDTVAGIRVDGSNELYVFMYGRFILIL